MRLIDTNCCSLILAGDVSTLRRAEDVGDDNFATSVIVQGELLNMAYFSEQKEKNLARVRDFLQDSAVYLVDEETAQTYGELKANLLNYYGPKERAKRRRTTIAHIGFSDNDLWIAATALQHGLIIVSSDSDFQRIHDARSLNLEDWSRP